MITYNIERLGINMDNGAMFFGIPVGFGMALTANERALSSYAQMSEADKERVIMQCKDARSDKEIEDIINRIGAGDRNSTDIVEIRDQIK